MKAYNEHTCTIKHDGREYSASGAFQIEGVAGVYITDKPGGGFEVVGWHGQVLGSCVEVSTWYVQTRWLGRSTWRSYHVRLHDGTCWHGRHNAETGQFLSLRPLKATRI